MTKRPRTEAQIDAEKKYRAAQKAAGLGVQILIQISTQEDMKMLKRLRRKHGRGKKKDTEIVRDLMREAAA